MSKPFIRQRITLTFEVSGFDPEIGDGDMQKNIDEIMHDWNEGRYPFDVELIRQGLLDVAKRAACNAIYNRLREKHGDKMVKSKDGMASISLAAMLSGKATEHVGYVVSETGEIKVETIDTTPGDDRYEFPEIKADEE